MQRMLKSKCFMGALAFMGLTGAGCGPAPVAAPVAEVASIEQKVTVATDDPPSALLKTDVAAALVEQQSVPTVHPELLPPNLEPSLQVAANVNGVWVTFFSEGAGLRNALGYFTYPEGAPPTSVPLATRQTNIIFPNSSASGSGGSLVQGNRMLLGSFPAGTRIGFFLIADACPTTTGCTAANINYTKPTYYSIDALNPETNATKKRHVLMVNHRDAKRLVLGFEDLNRETGGSDNDFNDVVFVVSWDPENGIPYTHPGIDPDSSCQAVKTRYPNSVDGVYNLNPCGDGVVKQYYCDMTTPGQGYVGGWTVGGWQAASATTSLGILERGTAGGTDWSRSLACLPFNESLVFKRPHTVGATTYGKESFTETLNGAQFRVTSAPYALGVAGRSFNQGAYGPSTSNIMMGCVSYNFDGTLSSEWACVTDTSAGGTAKGHVADYAMDTNCNPAVTGATWAWANNATCKYPGQAYTWGIGVR